MRHCRHGEMHERVPMAATHYLPEVHARSHQVTSVLGTSVFPKCLVEQGTAPARLCPFYLDAYLSPFSCVFAFNSCNSLVPFQSGLLLYKHLSNLGILPLIIAAGVLAWRILAETATPVTLGTPVSESQACHSERWLPKSRSTSIRRG